MKENTINPAVLDDDALGRVSGGEYGELLKPYGYSWATCTCGYRAYVEKHRVGKVICPQCNLLINVYTDAPCR